MAEVEKFGQGAAMDTVPAAQGLFAVGATTSLVTQSGFALRFGFGDGFKPKLC